MSIQQSYPSSILFITVGVCAVLVSAISRRPITNFPDVLLCCGLGALAGLLLGGAIGLHASQRWNRMWGGAAVGVLVGLVLGPMVLLPKSDVARVATIQIAGSGLLLIAATFFRLAAGDPLWGRPPVEPLDE